MKSNKKKTREEFKKTVFERDKYTCLGCDTVFNDKTANEYLDAHHITDRNDIINGGYVKENGISLCKEKCHMKAELYHITKGIEWTEGMHPNDLYEKIGSSKELAIQKSMNL